MAVRRELVYDERGGFAAADKHTPHQLNELLKIRNQGADGRGFAANPLGEAPALTVARYLDFTPYFDSIFLSV